MVSAGRIDVDSDDSTISGWGFARLARRRKTASVKNTTDVACMMFMRERGVVANTIKASATMPAATAAQAKARFSVHGQVASFTRGILTRLFVSQVFVIDGYRFCPKLDGWRMIVARKDLHRGNKKMKQISRRGFVKATGALAIPPALASLAATTARAQQNNNTADLRVDSNIVF